MSPAPAPARHVILLLGIALLTGLALAGPVAAQDTNETAGDGNETAETNETGGGDTTAGGAGGATLTEGNFVRHFSIKSQEEGCPDNVIPCWDISTLVILPGDKVVIHVDMTSGTHDLKVGEPINVGTPTAASGIHDLEFTMPAEVPDGGVEFICSVHAQQMVGHLVTQEALADLAGHESVPAMGVHFLAYWVGVIAFAILFVVYGLTFFLFKYNETRATTDHWDRSENAGGSPRLAAIAPLLAIVIAVAAIAAIVYVVMR